MSNKDDALQEIEYLFNQSYKVFHKDKKLANKYVQHARKIAMSLNIKLPSEIKRQFCKHCYSYLVPGNNLRVRINKNKIVYYCLECKKFWRKPNN